MNGIEQAIGLFLFGLFIVIGIIIRDRMRNK